MSIKRLVAVILRQHARHYQEKINPDNTLFSQFIQLLNCISLVYSRSPIQGTCSLSGGGSTLLPRYESRLLSDPLILVKD